MSLFWRRLLAAVSGSGKEGPVNAVDCAVETAVLGPGIGGQSGRGATKGMGEQGNGSPNQWELSEEGGAATSRWGREGRGGEGRGGRKRVASPSCPDGLGMSALLCPDSATGRLSGCIPLRCDSVLDGEGAFCCRIGALHLGKPMRGEGWGEGSFLACCLVVVLCKI